MNFLVLKSINLSLLKTNLKLFLLKNKQDIKFIVMSATWSTLLRVRSFFNVIFTMTFPILSALEVDEFLYVQVFTIHFFTSGKHHFLNANMFCCPHYLEFFIRLILEITVDIFIFYTLSLILVSVVIPFLEFLCWALYFQPLARYLILL